MKDVGEQYHIYISVSKKPGGVEIFRNSAIAGDFAHRICEDAGAGHRSETGLHGDDTANPGLPNGSLDFPHNRVKLACSGRRRVNLSYEPSTLFSVLSKANQRFIPRKTVFSSKLTRCARDSSFKGHANKRYAPCGRWNRSKQDPLRTARERATHARGTTHAGPKRYCVPGDKPRSKPMLSACTNSRTFAAETFPPPTES